MKFLIKCRKTMVFMVFVCFSLSSCENNVQNNSNTLEISKGLVGSEKSRPLLRHVVLFNFNADATGEILRTIENEFSRLPEEIAQIHSFEWGINNSPEGLDKGFTHCFLVSFLTEEDRDIYLPHPAHQKFVKLIGPYVEDVTVVDYWADH